MQFSDQISLNAQEGVGEEKIRLLARKSHREILAPRMPLKKKHDFGKIATNKVLVDELNFFHFEKQFFGRFKFLQRNHVKLTLWQDAYSPDQ